MSADGENFASVGTVTGASEYVYTPDNDFETLYFKVVQTVGEQSAESNVVSVTNTNPSEDITISAKGVYDEESGDITISWETNTDNGSFEIFMSEDGEEFTSIGIVEDVSEYVYTPATDFEEIYFKVIQTAGNKSAESNVVTVNNSIVLAVTASAYYDEENYDITIFWETNISNGSFEIFMSEDGEEFVSIGVIENVLEYIYTPENDFETLYFKVVQTVGEQSAKSNIIIVAGADDVEPTIYVTADYDKDSGKIIVSWISNVYNGYYEIFESEDRENFVSVGFAEGTSEFCYIPKDNLEVSYYKVALTSDLQTTESNIATVIIDINWEDMTDTDNDGLTDVFEKYYYGTDPNKADTDGDGLSDGYEVFYFGTNPAKFDSDDNGVSDGDEDFDNDGISNLCEHELGTDPFRADTDEDGLSDFDEINKYNTDPLKYDTDKDGISDGDEISLGLNPNSAVTDGTPDSEHTSEQHIEADSEIFADVNVDENPFKISIDITAAGIASNNLKAQESVFSNVMKNDAILGVCPEFIYTDGLKVDDVVINFDINNSAVSNKSGKYMSVSDEFVGIKRLNVFKYFEDSNILLPIETFHDVENNRVYTHVDDLGTYCLMDMEIWLESIGFEADEALVSSVLTLSARSNEASAENNIPESKSDKDGYLDIVMVIYPEESFIDLAKNELYTTSKKIFDEAAKENKDCRIYYVNFLYESIMSSSGNIYAENYAEAKEIINRCPSIKASYPSSTYPLYKAMNYVKSSCLPTFRDNSERFCFVIDVCGYPPTSSGIGAINTLEENNVKVCFSYSPGNTNQQLYLLLATGGACEQAIIGAGKYNFSDFVYNNIFTNPEKQNIILTSSGLKKLPDYFNKMTRLSGQDYDNDGIADPNELNLELVTFEEDSTIVYPSFDKIAKDYYGLFYVEQGLARLERDLETKVHNYMRFVKIMPIKSDPTEADGDLDGIPDILDKAPLSESQIPKAFKDLIVNRVVKYDSVVRMSDNCYVCYEPLYKFAGSSIVTDYVLTNGNLKLDDTILIQSCLSGSPDDIGTLCLAGTYVGKDEMYFVAPTDATDMELSVMASGNADYHRQQIIQSSELQNDIGYKLLKDYSEKISSLVDEQDTAFNNGLDFFYNSGEQMKLLGFYDEDSIINIGSLKDAFQKSAWRFVYQLACLGDKEHIESAITTTTVSYIEYSYWYRQQYPGSSGFEHVRGFIGNNLSKTCDYIILDINDRLMDGTPESRGEFLGERLFDICLDVAIGKIAGEYLDSKFASETLDDLDDIKTRFGANPVDNSEYFEVVDVYLDYEQKGYSYNVTSSQAKKIKNYIGKYENSFRTAVVKLNGKHLDDLIELTGKYGDDFLRVVNNSTDPVTMLDAAKLADECLISNRIIDETADEWSRISKYYSEYAKELRTLVYKKEKVRGNVAYAEMCLDEESVLKYKAVTKDNAPDGYAKLLGEKNTATDPNRYFRTEWLDESGKNIIDESIRDTYVTYNRCIDSEARIFEQIARELNLEIDQQTGKIITNNSVRGTINLFTEREPCTSCRGVIEQFKEAFPNITINVYWNKN